MGNCGSQLACLMILAFITGCGGEPVPSEVQVPKSPPATEQKKPETNIEITKQEDPNTEIPSSHLSKDPAADIAAGEKLFAKYKCTMCHKNPDSPIPGNGPVIQNVESRLSDEDLKIWLRDPAKKKPGTIMPAFRGSDSDLAKMIVYMKSL